MSRQIFIGITASLIAFKSTPAVNYSIPIFGLPEKHSEWIQDEKDKRLSELLNADPEYKKLSAPEQEVFYWVNFVRMYPDKFWDQYAYPVVKKQKRNQYTNSLKRDLERMSPVPVLKVSANLQQASSYHANDLIKSHKFQHTSSNGESFSARLKRFFPGSTIAENIHLGAGTPFTAVLSLLIDEKVPGSGHRESILSADYNAAGMTYRTYQDNKNILVQDFGK